MAKVQQALAMGSQGPRGRLVMVSHQASSMYVSSQLSEYQTVALDVEHSLAALVGGRRPITVVHASHPGAGKTFFCRTLAAGRPYLRVRVNHPDDNLVPRLAQVQGPAVVHLDVATPAAALRYDLRTMMLTGTLRHQASGTMVALEPEVQVLVELCAGADLEHWAWLPQQQVAVSTEMFCATPASLLAGMGQQAFEAALTPLAKDASVAPATGANAYERLQTVCLTLRDLEQHHGQGREELLTLDNFAALPGETCLRVLFRASKGQFAERPSLHCVWSFVNTMYLQLSELHAAGSVLNRACFPAASQPLAPTPNARAASGTYAKGQIVQFLTRTSIDFCTRQSRHPNGNTVVGLAMARMPMTLFNGRWERCGFDSGGRACFAHSQWYLMFRPSDERWVIVDSNDLDTPVCTSEPRDLNARWTVHGGWPRQHDGLPTVHVIRALDDYMNLQYGEVLQPTLATDHFFQPDYAELYAPADGGEGGDEHAEDAGDMAEQHLGLLEWNQGNHECLLFNNSTGQAYFLAQAHDELRSKIHPAVLTFLEASGIQIGESADSLEREATRILRFV